MREFEFAFQHNPESGIDPGEALDLVKQQLQLVPVMSQRLYCRFARYLWRIFEFV